MVTFRHPNVNCNRLSLVRYCLFLMYWPPLYAKPGEACSLHHPDNESELVLATGPGNPPAVWVWTAKTGRFDSGPGQKTDPLTVGGPNPDPYLSTTGFRRVWLDPSVPISGSVFRVSHLRSHSDMLLWIAKYWHWYCTLHFRRISCLDVQNKHTHAPNHILKMSVNSASTIFDLASSVIWVVLDHKHP